MNIQPITMPRHQAWNAFQQYRAALRKHYRKEDETLMKAYKAVAQQKRVISIVDVMREAGRDSEGRPKLAIIGVGATEVFCRVTPGGRVRFSIKDSWAMRKNAAAWALIHLPSVLPVWLHEVNCRAIVPTIPPQYRPGAGPGYFLLWEAEWRTIPKDPILLKHISAHFYSVLAQWDLTPLEQAVLGMR